MQNNYELTDVKLQREHQHKNIYCELTDIKVERHNVKGRRMYYNCETVKSKTELNLVGCYRRSW